MNATCKGKNTPLNLNGSIKVYAETYWGSTIHLLNANAPIRVYAKTYRGSVIHPYEKNGILSGGIWACKGAKCTKLLLDYMKGAGLPRKHTP